MKTRSKRLVLAAIAVIAVIGAPGCGGGGAGSTGGNNIPGTGSSDSAPIQILTASILPGTLQGHIYTAALTASNGHGALRWSISQIAPTALFVNGLSIDPSSGVLSGTVNFAGTAGFIAQVTDSESHSATKSFTVTAYSPLTTTPNKTANVGLYQEFFTLAADYQGGVQPLSFSLSSGSLPPGLRLNSSSGQIAGVATASGTYVSAITIKDSFSPPETVTQQMSVTVLPPTLSVASSLASRLSLNVPFSGNVIATGGTPPYSFSLTAGSLPPGLSAIDPNSGRISGTPTQAGLYGFQAKVTDSSVPTQSAIGQFNIAVAQALGRNDTIQNATPLDNGYFQASISPYIDPPDRAPTPGDSDYYKLISLAGATVHIETQAKQLNANNPLDSVLEIVDGNGIRLNTCRQPGDSSSNFNSPCINDDISASPHVQDSALDFRVPGVANTATTFYAHVLDWRGDARPDMRYDLSISGAILPLKIQTPSLVPAARGLGYSQELHAVNVSTNPTWSITSGSLPPGITLNSNGVFSGTATTDGSYSFTVQASDSSSPPQIASAQFTIQVVEPLKITSASTWPAACLNKPYSFAVQTSAGAPPVYWGFMSQTWPAINPNSTTGVFSGTPNVTGTFTGMLTAGDATNHPITQSVSLTVKNCP